VIVIVMIVNVVVVVNVVVATNIRNDRCSSVLIMVFILELKRNVSRFTMIEYFFDDELRDNGNSNSKYCNNANEDDDDDDNNNETLLSSRCRHRSINDLVVCCHDLFSTFI
jgi:hypothetical protein